MSDKVQIQILKTLNAIMLMNANMAANSLTGDAAKNAAELITQLTKENSAVIREAALV